jgi:glycosyltransferase involved in cell wall biosynthesis
MRRADLVLTDTPASAAFMASQFGVDPAKLLPVPVGADESVFYPRDAGSESGVTTVLYISTYLPLHGVSTVVEAANELREAKDIRFVLVGRGLERPRVDALARECALDNLRFIDWVDFDHLPDLIASCDIFLGGHFSHGNEKARRVVPGKVFQGLAMARPVILGDCEGNREWFTDGEDARIVPMADPSALASAISDLAADPAVRNRLADAGHALYESKFSEAAIAAVLDESLARLRG